MDIISLTKWCSFDKQTKYGASRYHRPKVWYVPPSYTIRNDMHVHQQSNRIHLFNWTQYYQYAVKYNHQSWWRHQMETFSALLAICAGNSPVSGEFPAQRPVTRSFDVFFDVRLIKRLSKHSRGWWFETLSHPLWRHRNEQSTLQSRKSTLEGKLHHHNNRLYLFH